MTEIKASEDPPCIIGTLCELHDGLLVEAKGIKEHYFKPYISKLFDRKVHLSSFKNALWCSDAQNRLTPMGPVGKCTNRQVDSGWARFSLHVF